MVGETSVEKVQKQLDVIRDGLQTILARLNEVDIAWKRLPNEVKAEIDLDPQALEQLPWKLYKLGQRAGWVFSNLPEAQKLLGYIKDSKNGIVNIGEFDYRLSGDNKQFIGRNPHAKR